MDRTPLARWYAASALCSRLRWPCSWSRLCKTISAGRVGLVLDGAIALTAPQLADFGFRRGPKSDAYRGDYYTLQP
jgi:hypothetical protein